MYEHVYYRVKKDVRARLLSYEKRCTSTSIIVKKMYEHVYYRKKIYESIIVYYYRKKEKRLLS